MERYEYDPYGQPSFFDANDNALNQSAVSNAILFTGRDYDAETSLYYYRARTMHPGLGRFMQHDPKMFVDGYNLYEYVKSNAINLIDPMGLDGGVGEVALSAYGYYCIAATCWAIIIYLKVRIDLYMLEHGVYQQMSDAITTLLENGRNYLTNAAMALLRRILCLLDAAWGILLKAQAAANEAHNTCSKRSCLKECGANIMCIIKKCWHAEDVFKKLKQSIEQFIKKVSDGTAFKEPLKDIFRYTNNPSNKNSIFEGFLKYNKDNNPFKFDLKL